MSVTFNRSAIECVTDFKYFGVIFDEHLNLNEHVKAFVSKTGGGVSMLGRARRCITLKRC